MQRTNPKLSIIITSYQNPELLRLCLESIKKNAKDLEYETIVADSSTGEQTYDLFKEDFKETLFIPNQKNKGFGGLVNQGLKKAKGDFLFIINADIIIKDNAIKKLLEFIEKDDTVGIVAPKLINFDNSVQQSCFRLYSLLTIIYRRTFLGRMSFAKKHLANFLMKKEQKLGNIFDADWVMGSAMMTRRKAVDKIGPYDKRYFMYFEDVDWCRRFWESGYRVVYNPKVKVFHYHGRASASRNAFSSVLFNKYTRAHISSSIKYFIKFAGKKNPHIEFNQGN
ncbi:glycosyltransferase family 2 protein [bacterium]|jgi:N-acetylglucosaminyl-diphospho-decaprenol L-rhamnosyltransferase|nr:glycosyltransferase family 2 protein [bacterium]MBT4250854.1 glycosyltransferase family 2 protein [bacterium]MBT4597567.1 glycosyltransferase family 2 protein [bacterium]MBT6754032.1 glycosyltransferase family 2 protein [bacterium]MBT7038062.1 glycosyltransferase family 2 protein [bacterium]